MNKDLIISKYKELVSRHQSFSKWIIKHNPEILESERGRNFIAECEDIESELSLLQEQEKEPDMSTITDGKNHLNCLPDFTGDYDVNVKLPKSKSIKYKAIPLNQSGIRDYPSELLEIFKAECLKYPNETADECWKLATGWYELKDFKNDPLPKEGLKL